LLWEYSQKKTNAQLFFSELFRPGQRTNADRLSSPDECIYILFFLALPDIRQSHRVIAFAPLGLLTKALKVLVGYTGRKKLSFLLWNFKQKATSR